VLTLFAFSLFAALFALGFLAAFFAFSLIALLLTGFFAFVLASFLASLTFDGTFGFAAHGAVTLVHAVVFALLSDDGGVLGSLGGLVVVASGHGKSEGHGGKSGKQNFFHFFDVYKID
jgi:hypothetical protein